MENLEEQEGTLVTEKIQKEVEAKVAELKAADPKLKRVYPFVIEGDAEDNKPFYIGYFKQPSFMAFSKHLALSQQDQANAMRELAKDCFIDGDKELIKDDSLFIFGLMPHLSKLISMRNGALVNLSKTGK